MHIEGATRDEALDGLADQAWFATEYLLPIFKLFGWTYPDWSTGENQTPDRDRLLGIIYALINNCRNSESVSSNTGRLVVTVQEFESYWEARLTLDLPDARYNDPPKPLGLGDMSTHDYETKLIKPDKLDSTHVLVGQSGGLSAVYDVSPSNIVFGCLLVETEHGPLYLDPDIDCEILVG